MRSSGTDGMLAQANELLKLGDMDQAEALLRQILLLDPKIAEALTLSAVIAHLRGRNEVAIELTKAALNANPEDPVAYITCGQAYRALGNLAAAEENLRCALRLEPNRYDAHLNLALTLWSAGEHTRAGTYFKNVLLLTKQSFQAFFYLGQIYQESGDWTAAEDCFRKALAMQPEHVEGRMLLGRLLLSRGRIPEASLEIEQGVALNPLDGLLRMAGACAAFELGYEDHALAHLQVAFADRGEDPDGNGAHGDCGRLCQFNAWCSEQGVELVRIAKQQRHKVRPVTAIPSGDRNPEDPHVSTPDVFIAGLSHCGVLSGDHLLISRDKSVCIEGVMTKPLHRPFTSPHILQYTDDGRVLLKIPNREMKVAVPCAYLGAADNFSDWLFECLTRLWAYQQRPACSDLPVVVQGGLSRWQSDLLDLLGYGEGSLIRIAESSHAVFDELFVASLSAPLNFVAPFSLEYLRRRLRKAVIRSANGPTRIFLTRQSMPTRRISNYGQIAPILDRYGFEAVPADIADIGELLRVMQSAEIVVGMEGAAMASIFMAPAHARIALITADEQRSLRYSGPARALGQEFVFLRGTPVFESNHRLAECDVRLEPHVFDEYLSKISF